MQVAFPPAGHRDGDFVFAPSLAEREDYQIPVGAPSFSLTFWTGVLALAPVVAVAYLVLL